MANIESVSNETRVFPPPGDFAAQANVTKADFERMNASAAADYAGFPKRKAKAAKEILNSDVPAKIARVLDEMGNITLGLKENTIFPECSDEDIKDVFGFAITIVTTAKTKEEAQAFLRLIGFPLQEAK